MADRPLLRIAGFNIRYAAAHDGEHAWRHRRRACLDTIAALDADVVGLQEVVGRQQRALARRFCSGRRGWTLVGVGRDDGRRRGERTSVLVRGPLDTAWRLTGVRTCWLSATPQVPGSIGWDAAFPRTVTVVSLRHGQTGRDVVVANTHFDHLGEQARLESARAVLALAAESPATPWVVVGDLNAGPDDPPLRAFADAGWRIAPARDSRATFHGWHPGSGDLRIDYVIASPHWDIAASEVVDHLGGRLPAGPLSGDLPSDHWPVRAELRLRS